MARREGEADQGAGPADQDLITHDRRGAAEADRPGAGTSERLGGGGNGYSDERSGETGGQEGKTHGADPGAWGRAESLHPPIELGNIAEA